MFTDIAEYRSRKTDMVNVKINKTFCDVTSVTFFKKFVKLQVYEKTEEKLAAYIYIMN